MRLIRTITGLFFLLIMVLPLMLTGIFEIRKIAVQFEMQESLEKNQLITLHLPSSEVHWYKKDKELLIGSSLFDVKSISKSSSGYIITGLFDHEEKMIQEYLEKLAGEDEEKKNKEMKLAFQLWYYEDHFAPGCSSYKLIKSHFPLYSEQAFHVSYPVIIPPPEFSLAG